MNWEFAICQVMTGIEFVQGSAFSCIYCHSEKQLRVGVHGDDVVPLGYIITVKRFFFAKLQEVWVVTNRRILGLRGTTTACNAFECWAGSWNGLLMASPGKQIHNMQSLSGSPTE